MKDKEKVGFVAIYRKIQDHWIWDDPERFHAWVDILISAQFHDSEKVIKGKLIKIPRGTWFISLRKLQKRWGWSRTKVSMFFYMLESEQMVSIKKTTYGTFIKVLNYEVYQSSDGKKKATEVHTEVPTEMHTEVPTEVQHTNKGNKGNNGNKKKKTAPSEFDFSPEELERHDPKDEAYWREALRREREGTLYD